MNRQKHAPQAAPGRKSSGNAPLIKLTKGRTKRLLYWRFVLPFRIKSLQPASRFPVMDGRIKNYDKSGVSIGLPVP